MPDILGLLRANIAYAFIAVGIIWAAVAFFVGLLVFWPVGTCVAAGLLLRVWPGRRLTWAWSTSTAVLGLLLSAYAAYVNGLLVSTPFATIAGLSLAGFGTFAVAHLFLLYVAYSPKAKPS